MRTQSIVFNIPSHESVDKINNQKSADLQKMNQVLKQEVQSIINLFNGNHQFMFLCNILSKSLMV